MDTNIVADLIKEYFDSQEWKYDINTENQEFTTFIISFNTDNERMTLFIRIIPNKSFYYIVGDSETSIPKEFHNGAVSAINEFNNNSMIVTGSIDNYGHINFSIGHNFDGSSFSIEAFKADFFQVYSDTDKYTARIFKKAICSTPQKRGLLSLFKRQA